jgi:hypothetical protein
MVVLPLIESVDAEMTVTAASGTATGVPAGPDVAAPTARTCTDKGTKGDATRGMAPWRPVNCAAASGAPPPRSSS